MVIKGLKTELTQTWENLPLPSLPKRGNSSLWKREGRRDFTNECRHYYESVNKLSMNKVPR
jgi:hypothetical protein